MAKEKIKTWLLILLVVSSLFLTGRIYLDQRFWPDGYTLPDGFAATLVSKFMGWLEPGESLNINVMGALDSVFSPRRIILSYTDGRLIFNLSKQEGREIRTALNDIIKASLSAQTAVTVDEAEWQSQLRANGVYADFSVPISMQAMARFLNVQTPQSFTLTSFDQIAVAANDFSQSNLSVYFRDSAQNKQMRVSPAISKDEIQTILRHNEKPEKENYAYAFEMNLDKRVEGEGMEHQKVLFNSYVLLPLDPVQISVITDSGVTLQEEDYTRILKLFGYHVNTVRRFTGTDDSVTFVDSASSLTIRPDGYLKYQAADESKGLVLGSQSDLTTAALASAKLLDDLISPFTADPAAGLFITSPLNAENETGSYTFSFAYLYNGSEILSPAPGAVTITTKNGRLVSLSAYIKNYTQVETAGERSPLDVLDSLYVTVSAHQSQDTFTILNLYTGYKESKAEVPLDWIARIENLPDPLIIP